ncbi:MAG: type II toxin-antitoxin system RelE/ParE family toxin [Bacteroidota bacterium]
MAKVILRQKAIDDLNDIWSYTSNRWSEKQADKYYATLVSCLGDIGENPNIGKVYDGINKDLLALKSGKHFIFYEPISKDRVEIVRILHAQRDIRNRITE